MTNQNKTKQIQIQIQIQNTNTNTKMSLKKTKTRLIHELLSTGNEVTMDDIPLPLRNDRELMNHMFEYSRPCYPFIQIHLGPVLRHDMKYILSMICDLKNVHEQRLFSFVESLEPSFFDNKEFVRGIVQTRGYFLKYASDRLKDDFDVVHMAMTTSVPSIEFASERLRNCKSLALMSLQYSSKCFPLLGEKARDDKDVVLRALRFSNLGSGAIMSHLGPTLRYDREFNLRQLYTDPYSFKDMHKSLRDDKNFVLTAVRFQPTLLKYASTRLRDDRQVVVEAAKLSHDAFAYASKRLQKDPTVQFWLLPPVQRRMMARKRLIAGVMEERRLRQKYDPLNPYVKELFKTRHGKY